MSRFEDFLNIQKEKYSLFFEDSVEKIRTEGLRIDPVMRDEIGGFLLMFRHSAGVAEEFEVFSSRLAGFAPTIAMSAGDFHTTVSPFGSMPGLSVSPEDEQHRLTLMILASATRKALCALGPSMIPEIRFSRYLVNQTTVIAEGIPNADFVAIADEVCSRAGEYGIELRAPWGAHATIARCTEDVPAEVLDPSFLEAIEKTPGPGMSHLRSLDIGWYSVSNGNFTTGTFERLSLPYYPKDSD